MLGFALRSSPSGAFPICCRGIKRINKVRLCRPVSGRPDAYPELTPALTRPIRQGTASTKAILRRFTRTASHPTYQAMELGRAQRRIFIARHPRSRELQREITEGLNVDACAGSAQV